jgi:Tfp pilus assembly protein PilN
LDYGQRRYLIMINLLPWRKFQRQQVGKIFLLMLLSSLVFVTLAIAIWHFNLKVNLDIKHKDNLHLEHEIAFLNDQLQVANKNAIKLGSAFAKDMHKLILEQTQTTAVFKDICDALPRGAYLQKIFLHNGELNIVGFISSYQIVKEYVLNLDRVSSIRKPIFYELERQSDGRVEFNMLIQKYPITK